MMTQAFTIDDNGRFGRILLFVILLHLILLMGTHAFPHTAIPLKRKMASLLEVIASPHANHRTPSVALNIATQHHASLVPHQADPTRATSPDEMTLSEAEAKGIKDHLALNQQRIQAKQIPTPRRKVISAAAHEAKDAAYLVKWQTYIEKYGNAHYPRSILNSNLQGNLRLLVAINRDGSLQGVTIRQSSGSPILDQAAIDIVLKAAPFDPLPSEIADETDVLEIIRTWQFRGKHSTLSQ